MTTRTEEPRLCGGADILGETWEIVVRVLLEESGNGLEPTAIRPETSLREELALGSLETIEAIMRLEDEYDVAINDQELASLQTVGDVARLVTTKAAASGREHGLEQAAPCQIALQVR